MSKREKAMHLGGVGVVVPPEGREGERSEPDRTGGGTTGARAAGAGFRPVGPEVPEKAQRRRYPVEYKLQILRQADGCRVPGEVGALLRREGLYSSLLSEWRRQRDEGALAGLGARRRGPSRRDPLVREIERLKQENERLRGKLQQAELIIDIQKKASEILGIPLRGPASEGSAS